MKNRFNRLTSKEWLPFQKSWFRFSGLEKLYEQNLRFFTLPQESPASVFFHGRHEDRQILEQVARRNGCDITTDVNPPINFALIDLLEIVGQETSETDYEKTKTEVLGLVSKLYHCLDHRRFLAVFVRNVAVGNRFYPYAWDLAKSMAEILSLKDEKIGCLDRGTQAQEQNYFTTRQNVIYCLYFRKDEQAAGPQGSHKTGLFHRTTQEHTSLTFSPLESWYVLKPQPRKKNEILHPAKYPEDLVDLFVQAFTREQDTVFDPMCGTGSTQLGALRNRRHGYGVELSEFFTQIAVERCDEFLAPRQEALFATDRKLRCKILNKDARDINATDFPAIDYMLTSPPYWDMLNMKGAENQANRKQKGLQLNYSDDEQDLGNIGDYQGFLTELCTIYFKIIDQLKPGGYLTIVVKNIKKKGKNYPFAWDLAERLQEKLTLLPEVFWCQDDISIAPYGYGNTWVSNTFHHYCLNFRKPG